MIKLAEIWSGKLNFIKFGMWSHKHVNSDTSPTLMIGHWYCDDPFHTRLQTFLIDASIQFFFSISRWCTPLPWPDHWIRHWEWLATKAIQSPPKESIHFCRAEYSKLRGARWKVGGAPNQPLSWLGPLWTNFLTDSEHYHAPPTFPVLTLVFEYLALPQVDTFFWWRLY